MTKRLDAMNASFAIGGIALGGAVGWWAGSLSACVTASAECQASVDAIAAVGTWVGGLGTVGAVIFAAATLRREQQESAARLRRENRRLEAHADKVAARIRPIDYDEEHIRQVEVSISNPPAAPSLTDVRFSIPSVGLDGSLAALGPGATSKVLCDLLIPLATQGTTREEALKELREDMMLEFRIEGSIFTRNPGAISTTRDPYVLS